MFFYIKECLLIIICLKVKSQNIQKFLTQYVLFVFKMDVDTTKDPQIDRKFATKVTF